MISFAVAFALLLHVFFWGAGLANLVMPRAWRRFWPVLVFPAGFALQSLVVWIATYANLGGTNRYALASELVPAVLLIIALGRNGWHAARLALSRFGLVWISTAGVLAVLVLPVAIASPGLTSVSLGSCDAADYAAGARVFMEFGRLDRSGFLGLTDVVKVMSADNFYDFWLRLNHFTPSALMALNGSILHCAPHQLATLLTMVVLAATVPIVFWVARALFAYSGAASLTIATVYGISPIPWYSVAHVSPAPLLAAIGIALLTWAAIALWNGRLTWQRGGEFAGVLAIGYVVILGSYNFILLVCLIPAIAYVGTRTLLDNAWLRLGRWALIVFAPLGAAAAVFWNRAAGLVERFMLFQTYDFGWRIPVLTPEGWLGMVGGGSLNPWSWGGIRWGLALLMVVALGWALVRAFRAGRRRVWLVASVAIPVLVGYAFLELRGIMRGTNASYDAFKLFAVFYPLLLPAFCWWITLRWSSRLLEWFAVAALALVVIGFNLLACVMFVVQLSRPPLQVDGELRQLRKIEGMAEVGSINILIPDMWSRLWANAFLLRRPQYFATHTYEARLNTPLRGEWDLVGGIARVKPQTPGARRLSSHYWLVDTRAPAFLRIEPADGWYSEERLPDGERWCWTRQEATFRVDNPHTYPVQARVRLDGRAIGDRDVGIGGPGQTPAQYVRVNAARRTVTLATVTIPPGRSILALHSKQPATQLAGDNRSLAVCVFSLVLETSADK